MKFTKRLRLWALFNRYYAEDGEPIRCFDCGSVDLAEKVMDYADWTVCEKYTYCCDYRTKLNHWAYGYWAPPPRPQFLWVLIGDK